METNGLINRGVTATRIKEQEDLIESDKRHLENLKKQVIIFLFRS